MICSKCRKNNEDGRIFCCQCGELLETPSSVLKIQALSYNSKICYDNIINRDGVILPNKRKKLRPFRLIIFALVLLLAMAAAFFLIRYFSAKSISNQPAYYLKNDVMMGCDYSDESKYVVSETPAIDSLNYADTGLKNEAFYITPDYRYCYFLQSGNDILGYSLCRCVSGASELSDKNGTFIKIDSNVISYKCSDDGEKVIYKKSGATDGVGKIYYFNGSHNYGIADNVYDYCVNKDFSTLYYTKSYEGGISLYELKLEKPEKSNKVCDGILKIDLFGNSVVYTADFGGKQNIYIKNYGESPVLLGNGEEIIINGVFENCFYYSKASILTLSVDDVVSDELLSIDAILQEPKATDFDSAEDYANAVKRYGAKLTRDSVRSYLLENPINVREYTLYVYGNSSNSLVDSGISNIVDYSSSGETVCYIKMASNLEKTSLNEYSYGYDLQKVIKQKFEKSGVLCIRKADGSALSVTDTYKSVVFETAVVTDSYSYYITKQDGLCFFDLNTGISGELSPDITGLIPVDDGMSFYATYRYVSGESDFYSIYRIYNDGITLIADDVTNCFAIDAKSVAYVKCTSDNDCGVLYLNIEDRETKIDTDVYAYRVVARSAESILYFKNYSEERGYSPKADLYWYKSSPKPSRLDTDVSSIIF